MNNKTNRHLKRTLQKSRKDERVDLVKEMPQFDITHIDTVTSRVEGNTLYLDSVLVELRDTNPLIGAYIMLVSGDDILCRYHVMACYLFFLECGKLPYISKMTYKTFMCFDKSPEDTAKINAERLEAINSEGSEQTKSFIKCCAILAVDAPGRYMLYVHLLYVLLGMQCKINKALF